MPFIFMFTFSHFCGHLVAHHQPLSHLRWVVLCTSTNKVTPMTKQKNFSLVKVRVRSILLMMFCMFSYKPPLALYGRFWSQACVW